MHAPHQLRTAIEEAELRRVRQLKQRARNDDLDLQLRSALGRIEKGLDGVDVHKHLADLLTDDEEHPVSVTQVYDWLARRNNRRPPAELVLLICELDDAFAKWWCETAGFEAPIRRVLAPLEQQVEDLKHDLLDFGTAGEKKLSERQAAWGQGAQMDLGIHDPAEPRRKRSRR